MLTWYPGAILAWIADIVACDELQQLPFGLPYPQLHAFGWHFGTSLGLLHSTFKVSLLAAAHVANHCSRGPPACSRLPCGPEARALVARMPTRGCSGALMPA